MALRLNISPDTASKAMNEVIEKGFIVVTEQCRFNVKDRRARRFALTFQTIEKSSGQKILPTNEWNKMFK